MHKKNMRVKDLFSKSGFDKSGDGMLDVDEFCMALELLGVQFSKKETRVLVQFLDESGDGEIEAYELENALRRLRKDVAVLKEAREAAKEEEASRGRIRRSRSQHRRRSRRRRRKRMASISNFLMNIHSNRTIIIKNMD